MRYGRKFSNSACTIRLSSDRTTTEEKPMPMTALDYEEIRQLLARYARAVDFGDIGGILDCFTPDAYFESVGLPNEASHADLRFEGKDQLGVLFTGVYRGIVGHTRHCVNTPVIEGDGETATVFCYLFILRVGMAPHAGVLLTGTYEDRLVKQDGRWRFRARVCKVDPQPEHRSQIPTDVLVVRFDEASRR
jgi:ketosteroid isomerase-like protein